MNLQVKGQSLNINKTTLRSSFFMSATKVCNCLVIALTMLAIPQIVLAKKAPESTTSVFVSPRAKNTEVRKVAVLPFKAPVELAGASIADVFTTEILKTYKYRLIERSQMEQVLDEKVLGMQGVISSSEAIQIGKLLGVEGVIIGTVPEYGLRANGENEVPSVGINVRMIHVNDGSIVWSISDSAIGRANDPISSLAVRLVKGAVNQLRKEWVRTGYTLAVNLPSVEPQRIKSGLREVVISFAPQPLTVYTHYRIYRSRTNGGQYNLLGTVKNSGKSRAVSYTDSKLLDAETYYYKIVGVAPSGLNGAMSSAHESTTAGPPRAVAGFSVQGDQARKATLTWRSNTDLYVKGYNVFRSNSKNGVFQKIKYLKGVKTNNYTDKGNKRTASLNDFTEYYYQISSVNLVDVESRRSAVITIRTKPIPKPVKGYKAKTNEVKKATISWQQNTEHDIKAYRILNGKTQAKVTRKLKDLPLGTTEYTHTRLKDGTTYYYRIFAIDNDGLESIVSDVFHSSTKPRPLTPSGFTLDHLGDNVSINWLRNSERDIKFYEIKVSGSFQTVRGESSIETTKTSYKFSGLKPGGSGKFKVRAVDATGLASDFTKTLKVKIPKLEK